MSEVAPAQELDPRIAIVLGGLVLDKGNVLGDGQALTADTLAASLEWHESLNAAVLPVDPTEQGGEPRYQALVAHSTFSNQGLLVPDLSFDARPPEHQTRVANVYGTGLYVANRREAALRANRHADREVGAFITAPFSLSEVTDSRRRFVGDIAHLGGMVLTETIAPKIFGQRAVAKHIADRADSQMLQSGTKVRLLNEAPRSRAEKLAHETVWRYDLVPPQYMLLRMPMARIGTYEMPTERPQRFGVVDMYLTRFWRAAAANSRSMTQLHAPHKSLQATSKG